MGVHHPNDRGHTKALEFMTPTRGATPKCGPLKWGDKLQCFCMAAQAEVMDSQALMWPLELE